jgi:hypothetical protein
VDKAFLSYRLADQLQYAYTNASPASAVYVGQSIQAVVQWLKVESKGCSLQLVLMHTQPKQLNWLSARSVIAQSLQL